MDFQNLSKNQLVGAFVVALLVLLLIWYMYRRGESFVPHKTYYGKVIPGKERDPTISNHLRDWGQIPHVDKLNEKEAPQDIYYKWYAENVDQKDDNVNYGGKAAQGLGDAIVLGQVSDLVTAENASNRLIHKQIQKEESLTNALLTRRAEIQKVRDKHQSDEDNVPTNNLHPGEAIVNN